MGVDQGVLVRSSDPTQPSVLYFTDEEWTEFVGAVKRGEFDMGVPA